MNANGPVQSVLKSGVSLYLIRHGETDWNRAQRYQGQCDIPLNDTGREQAQRNGRALGALMPEIGTLDFVSSPLSRAVETMTLMREAMGMPRDNFRQDERLMELHYGHWEGHLASALPEIDPQGVREKMLDPFGWRPRNGESYADLSERIRGWIASIEHDTVAVTHGGVTRVARGLILNLESRAVPTLEVPQDKILFLRDGAFRWI